MHLCSASESRCQFARGFSRVIGSAAVTETRSIRLASLPGMPAPRIACARQTGRFISFRTSISSWRRLGFILALAGKGVSDLSPQAALEVLRTLGNGSHFPDPVESQFLLVTKHSPRGMLRTTLHLVLVAGLLACPLRCSARSLVSSPDDHVQAVNCCCGGCDTESNTAERSSDCPQDEGCDCGNCICNGAVITNDADIAAEVDPEFVVFLTPIEVRLSGPISLTARVNHDQRCVHRYLSGRDARIAHQSWLI